MFFGNKVELNKVCKITNSSDYEYECKKKFADKVAEAKFAIDNEKDPLKREKMTMRLYLGILDFSDL